MNLLYILKKPERAFSIFNGQVSQILSSLFIDIFFIGKKYLKNYQKNNKSFLC